MCCRLCRDLVSLATSACLCVCACVSVCVRPAGCVPLVCAACCGLHCSWFTLHACGVCPTPQTPAQGQACAAAFYARTEACAMATAGVMPDPTAATPAQAQVAFTTALCVPAVAGSGPRADAVGACADACVCVYCVCVLRVHRRGIGEGVNASAQKVANRWLGEYAKTAGCVERLAAGVAARLCHAMVGEWGADCAAMVPGRGQHVSASSPRQATPVSRTSQPTCCCRRCVLWPRHCASFQRGVRSTATETGLLAVWLCGCGYGGRSGASGLA